MCSGAVLPAEACPPRRIASRQLSWLYRHLGAGSQLGVLHDAAADCSGRREFSTASERQGEHRTFVDTFDPNSSRSRQCLPRRTQDGSGKYGRSRRPVLLDLTRISAVRRGKRRRQLCGQPSTHRASPREPAALPAVARVRCLRDLRLEEAAAAAGDRCIKLSFWSKTRAFGTQALVRRD